MVSISSHCGPVIQVFSKTEDGLDGSPANKRRNRALSKSVDLHEDMILKMQSLFYSKVGIKGKSWNVHIDFFADGRTPFETRVERIDQ